MASQVDEILRRWRPKRWPASFDNSKPPDSVHLSRTVYEYYSTRPCDHLCHSDELIRQDQEIESVKQCSFARLEILGLLDSSFAQLCHDRNWIHGVSQEMNTEPDGMTVGNHAGNCG